MHKLSYFQRNLLASMLVIWAMMVIAAICPGIAQAQQTHSGGTPTRTAEETTASYEPDCNDPDAHDINCTEPTKAIIQKARRSGYPYYIGHAEPTAKFFSTRPTSGSNMQWKFQLPLTEPSPAQDGSRVANFELYSTFWLGLALCDPNSDPFGTCVAASDTNNPNTAGAAFLELQFYPPGINCSNTQWCANLHINTLQDNNAFQNMNCLEPTTAAFVTTDGTPGGPKLLMSNGDDILVTIHDTANGLQTDVKDLTTSATGTMVASGANGYKHNSDKTTCATTAFDFHAMYATASPGQVVPWASLRPNVAFDFEIGHFELCGNASCSMLPDGGDTDDTNCGTTRGIGGCFGGDLDHDGTPYLADWPDGNTAAHPATVILGSPDDKGVGPLSANNEGYTRINFRTTEGTNGAFYPFFTQAGTGAACRFTFGNDIPGTTTNDFGKIAQYGTTIDNPCLPGTAVNLAITKTGPATVVAGTDLTYTIGVSNSGPSNATNLVLTDILPAGAVLGPITGPNASACTFLSVGMILTCFPGSLDNGASITYTVTVHVPSGGVGSSSITNTAHITSDQLDPNSSNDTASATTAVVFRADLSITKSGAPNPVAAGTTLTYSITVHNAGPSDANNVVVNDTLPAGVTFTSGPCSGTTVLTCNLGTVVNGGNKNFNVQVKIPADFLSNMGVDTATITNTVVVTSSATDPNSGNNTASVNTKVIAVADLDITMTGSPNPVHEGSIVTYTMHVTSTGPSDAIQGFLFDYLPQGFAFVSGSVFPCGSGVGVVLCNLGPVVPAGFSVSFPVQLRVQSNLLQPGETSRNVTNSAKVTSHTLDSDAGDFPVTVVTTVIR